MIRVKRVYEDREPEDGLRVLVDGLWPRGLRSDDPRIGEWQRQLAPSDELRRWFGHRPERWQEFRRRYAEEMNSREARDALRCLAGAAMRGNVTLVYAAKDTQHNNAVALKTLIEASAPAT